MGNEPINLNKQFQKVGIQIINKHKKYSQKILVLNIY